MTVRLFVGNLPYDVTEPELRAYFASPSDQPACFCDGDPRGREGRGRLSRQNGRYLRSYHITKRLSIVVHIMSKKVDSTFPSKLS